MAASVSLLQYEMSLTLSDLLSMSGFAVRLLVHHFNEIDGCRRLGGAQALELHPTYTSNPLNQGTRCAIVWLALFQAVFL